MEALEHRRLMSNSVSLVNGLLSVQGSSTVGSNLTVNLVDSGTAVDASADEGQDLVVPLASVKQIQITGGSGADYIFVDSRLTLPVTISGGDGNDSVRGGGGTNVITEGNGNDWVDGRGTTNSIKAGNGNDTLLGANGNDTIVAGGGTDSIDGGAGNDSITVGNGNDTVTGDAGDDTIIAGNGGDSINGGLGNDSLTVGTGLSTIIPGSGANQVQAGNSADIIVPSSGTNTVVYTNPQVTVTASLPSNTSSSTTTTTTSTTTTTTNSPTEWNTYSAVAATGTNPQAVMQIYTASSTVGIGVDVRALNSVLGSGSPIDANYQWNFGDPSGEYNTLTGFNASHIYTTAGTYTISLTVTNNLNETSTVTGTVTISADTRKAIYVDSVNGSDSNTGSSPSQAVQSAARADQLVGNNTKVFFDRGETFNLSAAFKLDFTDVLVGAYGSGAQPIINYTAPVTGSTIFTTNSTIANGVTIQDLTLTTLDGTDPTVANQPMGVSAGGYDTSVLRCTFDYVEYDVNGNSAPIGLNVIDNTSPISGGLEGYFVWDQGTDTTIIGNTVNGSVHEHVMRTSSASEILAYGNNFSNFDGKGCIEIHEGSYAWIDSNTVDSGDIRVGPLGLWNEPITSSTDDCVVQNNKVINTAINVYAGAHDISIRNNIIWRNGSAAINVEGQDGLGRQSADIRILNNTGINTGTQGQFLMVQNHTDGILLENNLFDAPNLAVGANSTAPVFVDEANLSSFTYINGNVWQIPGTFYAFADGGINYVGEVYTSTGYLTQAEWNAQSEVGTDFFYSVTVDPTTGAPAVGSAIAAIDAALPGVYGDINGASRPTTGGWTAGAVQA